MLGILKSAGVTNCKTWCGESEQIDRAFAKPRSTNPKYLLCSAEMEPSAQVQKRALEQTLTFSRFQAER